MDETKLQAWWAQRSGLDGSAEDATPAQVLERAGWARSVGGAGPYLAIFARCGASRTDIDRAAAKLAIHELPSARGCTYVLPASDFALGLAVGQESGSGEMRVASKLGVTDKELDKLCDAVVAGLAGGALDPDGIRAVTGTASRSLGEAGKKKGMTTTLPLALGRLQSSGHIRRVPMNGRLDHQRYQYALWKPNPIGRKSPTGDDAYTELARRYFTWHGPATLAEFQWFSGLGVKRVKEVIAPLELAAVEPGNDRLLLPADAAAWKKFKPPGKPRYVLVGSLDPIAANRRNVATLLLASDRARKVQLEKSIGTIGTVADLPNHAILDRGRLVGLWDFDPEAGKIVASTFGVKDKALDAAIARTEGFVRDQLGDARSFSLDSPASRVSRIAALAKAR